MKTNNDTKIIEATEEQFTVHNPEPILFKERVIDRIRAVYSVDDEIAIIRQRDTKPLEFEEYNKFVEQVKAEEKER